MKVEQELLMLVSFPGKQEEMTMGAKFKQQNEALPDWPETERLGPEDDQIQGMAV